MSKIGIGVTTYNRPEMARKCIANITKYTGIDKVITNPLSNPLGRFSGMVDGNTITITVAYDSDEDRKGVAHQKNECLRDLKNHDCDVIFLLDDDCSPINYGWMDFFINSGERHLLYLNNSHKPLIHYNNLTTYADCGGVFMYMTRECIEKVGAFDETYKTWGFEHADYSKRIAMAFGEKYPYKSMDNTSMYLRAEDYNNPFHKSSISDKEKKEWFGKNFPKFKEPIKNIYIPL